MILPRVIDVMLSGVQGKGRGDRTLDQVLLPQRTEFLETLTAAKAFELDFGTTFFCNSLVPDLQSEAALINHVAVPYEITWVEFDRTALYALPSFKGVEVRVEAPRAGLDIGEIGFLFDNRLPEELVIHAWKNRGPVIVEPMVAIVVPKEPDGTFRFGEVATESLDWTAMLGAEDGELHGEAQVLRDVMHIPFALFAVMNNPRSGLEQSTSKAGFKARKIRDKASKGRVARSTRMPEMSTVKLSELGQLHNEAVLADRAAANGTGSGRRASPRRHPVRGHLAHRNGKPYWRPPHYRGVGPSVPSYTLVVEDRSDGEGG